jgi:hypothetical protein
LSAIFNDETGVEYVKKEGLHRNHSKMFLLREIFGHGMIHFFLVSQLNYTVV